MPLHRDSRPLTAFLFNISMYQFTRVPFGLKIAGSAFIRALKNAWNKGSERLKRALRTYIDDLVIGTSTFTEHVLVLKELFEILIQYNFTINIYKCEFFKKVTSFLSFLLSAKGIIPNPDKIDTIIKFETPKNQKNLQQFLGICDFYRQFCLKCSNLISPFRDLLKSNAIGNWTTNHAKAFNTLKE